MSNPFNPDKNKLDEEIQQRLPVKQQLILLGVVLLLIFSSAFSPSFLISHFKKDEIKSATQAASIENVDTHTEQHTSATFKDVAITGKAAYVWDVANQRVLFKKNESEQLPLASLTKLMTALLAQEILEEKQKVSINETAIRQDGESGLMRDESFERLALSDLTLMSSSNDGAYALAYAAGTVLNDNNPANAFVQAMNIRAKEIGLTATYFKNPTGLDISTTEGGAYGTARDIAFLMEYIIDHEPGILAYTTKEEAEIFNTAGTLHDAENTNYYVDEIPGLIGSKTGYTDLAGGNLVVAFEAGLNRPVIIAVLGSTRQERFSDVLALVKASREYIAQE